MDRPTLLYRPHVKHCHRPGDTEHQEEELASAIKQGVIIGITHVFHALTFAGSRRSCLKTRLSACVTYWVILHAFLSSSDFFQNLLFQKNLLGIPSKCQQLDPDQANYFFRNIEVG